MKNVTIMVTDVERVSVRAVAGQENQVELIIGTASADLTFRLIPFRRRKSIRVIDLRQRDRAKKPGVPFTAVYND